MYIYCNQRTNDRIMQGAFDLEVFLLIVSDDFVKDTTHFVD